MILMSDGKAVEDVFCFIESFIDNHGYTIVTLKCPVCGVLFYRTIDNIVSKLSLKKSMSSIISFYCSSSCSASYSRSKFEIALEEIIKTLHPNEEIITNDRKILNGYEIDIYFPRVKLGIEVNGIRHYKDIHGDGSLEKIKRRDKIKRDRARRLGITIKTINISGKNTSNVNSKTGKKLLEEAVSVIKSFL